MDVLPTLFRMLHKIFTSLVYPYHLYEIRLISTYHDKKKCRDMVELCIANRKVKHKISAIKAVKNKSLMRQLHFVDALILQAIVLEEQYRAGQRIHSKSVVEGFGVIDAVGRCFFSDTSGRHFLILVLPDGGHEICLPVRDLLKSPEYLHYLHNMGMNETVQAFTLQSESLT